MAKRIPLDQLTLGMRITGLDKSWMDTPFLRHRLTITKQDQIDKLRACGVRFVDIEAVGAPAPATAPHRVEDPRGADPIDDLDALVDPRHPDAPDPEAPAQGSGGALPASSFDEELVVAKAVYREARRVVEESLQDARMGHEIKTEPVARVVDRLVDSVLRNLDALTSLSRVKSFDHYTFFHSVNTSVLALALGVNLKMDREELQWLGVGSLLHDVGKVKIPLEILNKPARYQPDEYEIMKQHAMLGAEILANTPGLPEAIVRPALEHHERLDGTGYPFRRAGEELTRFGRIASIVDIYDALTTDRVYQKATSPHRALQLLFSLGQRGQLDRSLVERFIQCVGVYPVGSCVVLNTKEIGLVAQIHRDQPLHPKLLIVRDAAGRPMPPLAVDLTAQDSTTVRTIAAVLDPSQSGIDPNAYLDDGLEVA